VHTRQSITGQITRAKVVGARRCDFLLQFEGPVPRNIPIFVSKDENGSTLVCFYCNCVLVYDLLLLNSQHHDQTVIGLPPVTSTVFLIAK
jgi:hypothetical protein